MEATFETTFYPMVKAYTFQFPRADMVVELKDKLEAVTVAEEKQTASKAGVEADVVSALTNLGYDGRQAESAVAEGKRAAGVASFEKLLKAALQALAAPQGQSARSGSPERGL